MRAALQYPVAPHVRPGPATHVLHPHVHRARRQHAHLRGGAAVQYLRLATLRAQRDGESA